MQTLWIRNRLTALLAASCLVSVGASAAFAQGDTCNGLVAIGYPNVQTPNVAGSIDTARITIGAGAISGGTELTVEKVFFGLDCDKALLPACVDDGPIAGFVNDPNTITTTCGGSAVSANSSGGASPNQVVFTFSPPVMIPANNPSFCSVTFQFEKLTDFSTDITPTIIEQNTGFSMAMCDNDLAANSVVTGSVSVDSTPPPPFTAPAASHAALALTAFALSALGVGRVRRRRS